MSNEEIVPARSTYLAVTAVAFKFHASHFTSGNHYLTVKFEDGREIDVDLRKTYTLETFSNLLGSIPDVFIVNAEASQALLADLEKKNG